MPALLHDAAVADDQNLIGMAHGLEAMCNHDMKTRTVRGIQQQTKFIQMRVHVIDQFQCSAVGVFRHDLRLRLGRHLMKFLLNPDESLRHLV